MTGSINNRDKTERVILYMTYLMNLVLYFLNIDDASNLDKVDCVIFDVMYLMNLVLPKYWSKWILRDEHE